MRSEWQKIKFDEIIDTLTDYHANGSYEVLKKNVTLLDVPDYAVMIRTTNFENNMMLDSNLKYITEDAYNYMKKTKVFPDDIIMNKIANPGTSYYMPDLKRPVSLAMNLFLIRVDTNKAIPRFIYYYLRANEAYVKSFALGSVTQTITKQAVRDLEIYLPNMLVQGKITNIVGMLEDKIELNRKMNQTLEEMAQVIFKSWFVDFDPVHVKMACANEEELRQAAKELGISKEVLELFPSEFEESELGMIPKGWEVIQFNKIASVRKGLSYKGKHKSENTNDIPMFNLGNFDRSGQYRSEKIAYYNGDYNDRHLIRGGQLMIANTDMTQDRIILGLPLIVPNIVDTDMIFTHHVFAIDFKSLDLEPKLKYYVFYTFLNPKFREMAEGYATGTTVLALPKDGVMKFNLLLASEVIVDSFNKVVQELVAKMTSIRSEIETLQKTRDTLLPKLLSGEVEV